MENKLEKSFKKGIPLEFSEFGMLKEQISRIINVFDNNMLPPYEILIHPSSICNLNCKWCIGSYVSRKKSTSDLLDNNLFDINNMKKIIDSIVNMKKEAIDPITGKKKKYSVERVSFSGITGEPFVAKKSILYAIDTLTDVGIKVGIFTNGTLISEDMIPTLLKLKYLLISIDAGNKETYESLKCDGKDSNIYEDLLTNIEKLTKAKQKESSKLEINVGYIINQYNYKELYDLACKLKEIGVHYLRFKTDIASLLNMSNSEREYAKNQINKIKEELCDSEFNIVEIHNVLDDNDKVRSFNKCFVHYLIGNISADGRVYPCNYHPKKNGYYFEDALKEDFSNIWYNMFEYDLDKKIPDICPKVCDPFKNRANALLEDAYNIYKEDGLEYLLKCIEDIDNKYF